MVERHQYRIRILKEFQMWFPSALSSGASECAHIGNVRLPDKDIILSQFLPMKL